MKKITLNETDLIKIVKRVLNEQKDRQFNEDEVHILYHIFEREFKPPFRKGEIDIDGDYVYYDRNNQWIGLLQPNKGIFAIHYQLYNNIRYKVCQVFEFSYDTLEWWYAIRPHLKSWSVS